MSLADTTEGLTEVDIWARTSDCIGILAFADMRPSGMEDHPVLKDWFKVWAAANPARPSRWDYWTSADTDPDFVLKEKLRQSPDIPKVLTAEESERLIAALDHECPAEPPINIGDLLPLVEYTRGLYPATLTPEESGRVINHVAWVLAMETGLPFGLSVKRGGNNVPSPQGEPVAYDIVELQGAQRLWDCFTDEAANMTATWHETEYHEQPDSRPWLAPVAP